MTMKENDFSSDQFPVEARGDRNNLTGRTVGSHYKILERIGAGGLGTVYRAHHQLLDRQVAIKFILPELLNNERTLLRFQREAQATTRLQHANICSVREFAIDPESEQLFLAMEYVSGTPLSTVLENGKIETQKCLELILQICRGMEHAHSQGIIHRDLKPQNIIAHRP